MYGFNNDNFSKHAISLLFFKISFSSMKKFDDKSFIVHKFSSYIVNCFGPARTKFLAISIPNPLRPINNIFKFVIFSIVSIPYVYICLEYKL